MGFFDDVKDKVDDVVDDAKDTVDDVSDSVGEAAGDVAEGAGDVADEVSEGDVGGAVDEATDTVEDVASGDRDTGSNDSSSSSGSSSSGGSSGGSGISIDTGGSSSSSDSSSSGTSSSGGSSSSDSGSSSTSSSGGSSGKSPKETVKEKVGKQDSLESGGNTDQNSGSRLPENVKGEIDRVKGRISDMKKSMEDGTWRAGMREDIKQKQEYLQELQQRNPNAEVDRTANVILDEEGNTLGVGDTPAEAEYNARANTSQNRDFDVADEEDIARVGRNRAQEAAANLEEQKRQLENDEVTQYQVNAEQLSNVEKEQLGIDKSASGNVVVQESQLRTLYNKKKREVEEQAESYQNFLVEAEKNQEINNLNQTIQDPQASATEKAEAAEQLADKVGGQQGRELENYAEELRNTNQELTNAQKRQEVRDLVKENPNLLSWGGQFNEAGDQVSPDNPLTKEQIENQDLAGIQEDILGGKPAPEPARERFKELQGELNLTDGELDTIAGSVKAEKTTEDVADYFDEDNPVVENFAKGVAGAESTVNEAVDTLPTFKREFDSKTEQQLYDTRTGRTATSQELMAGQERTIELENGEEISLGTVERPDYSPEIKVDDPGDPFSLQDARTVSRERVDELAGGVGQGIGGIAATPYTVQEKTGQAQELASGEMTLQEAKEGTINTLEATAEQIVDDPVKAGVTTLPSVITGTAVSRRLDVGGKVKRGAVAAKNKVTGGSTKTSDIAEAAGTSGAVPTKSRSELDGVPSTEDLPYNIQAAPDPDSINIQNVAPSRADLLDASEETLSKSQGELTQVPQDMLRGRGRRRSPDTRSPGRNLDEEFEESRLRDLAESSEQVDDNELMSLSEEARRQTGLKTADNPTGSNSKIDDGEVTDADRPRSSSRLQPEEGFRRSEYEVLRQRRPGRGVNVEDVTDTGGLSLRVIDESDLPRSTLSLNDAAEAVGNSNKVSMMGTGALVDLAEAQQKVEADYTDTVSGTSGLAGGKGDTLNDLNYRAGDTGRTDPAVYRNSPGRPRVGNDAPADTSGQVIGLSNVAAGAGSGGVIGLSNVEDQVVSENEARERANPREFASGVVGLGAAEGQLRPPQAREGRGRGRGKQKGVDNRPAPAAPDVSAREPVEPEIPEVGGLPVFNNRETQANRQGDVVGIRPGVDQRNDATVIPGAAMTSGLGVDQNQGQRNQQDQRAPPTQRQQQDLVPGQQQRQQFDFPEPFGRPPANRGGRPPEDNSGVPGGDLFNPNIENTGIPGSRPRGDDDEEDNRAPRRRTENIDRQERIWPIGGAQSLLFGDNQGDIR